MRFGFYSGFRAQGFEPRACEGNAVKSNRIAWSLQPFRKCPRKTTAILTLMFRVQGWVLPPLSNSWMILSMIWLYIALNRTPSIDCYWVGAVPKV